jgi:hypothetical protein
LVDKKKDLKGMDLFIDIIEKTYIGANFQYGGEIFRLTPTLVRPADFHKKPTTVQTVYDALLKTLDPAFKALAASEVYRASTGWIAKGVNGYRGHKIRKITVGEEVYLLPNISRQATVGIDTSGCRDNLNTVMVVCSIPDFEGAYLWLEKHLALPKDVKQNEFHWNKLGQSYRKLLLDNFEMVLSVCCDCLLVLKTSVFIDRRGYRENIFVNLMRGCFSGFETDPIKSTLRAGLRQRFFRAINGVAVHCDDDFASLRPETVVRLLVQTLANQRGDSFENYTPLTAHLHSHESKPIQIADIIAGMVKTKLENKDTALLEPLPFDPRKLTNYSGHLPKVYFWLSDKEV